MIYKINKNVLLEAEIIPLNPYYVDHDQHLVNAAKQSLAWTKSAEGHPDSVNIERLRMAQLGQSDINDTQRSINFGVDYDIRHQGYDIKKLKDDLETTQDIQVGRNNEFSNNIEKLQKYKNSSENLINNHTGLINNQAVDINNHTGEINNHTKLLNKHQAEINNAKNYARDVDDKANIGLGLGAAGLGVGIYNMRRGIRR